MKDLKTILQGMARSAVQLETAGKDGAAVGRFGGLPDVPPDFTWPVFKTAACNDKTVKDRPLGFLAQFDCAALTALDPEGLLPHEGILSFFYELDSQPWGYDPEDAGCARVYWFPDKSVLAPAAGFPEDLEACFRFPPLSFHGRQAVEYPSYPEFPLFFLEDGSETADGRMIWEVFDEARNALRGYEDDPQPFHRLLGWPVVIQNAMPQQCELVSQGYYMGNGLKGIPQKVLEDAEKSSLDGWRLLFQLDTVRARDFELMFGDCGSIYFYIRKEDLAARRFDRVWLIQQCY